MRGIETGINYDVEDGCIGATVGATHEVAAGCGDR